MSQTATVEPSTGPGAQQPLWQQRRVQVAAILAVVVLAAGATWLLRSGDDKAPYTDARSTGTLTLCGADGKPVTAGSTTKAPFVSRAVGATAASGALGGAGRTAALYAFQPRQGTDSQEWSGQLLTAASDYTDPTHPMAQATSADIPLTSFLTAFPARWQGFVQVRLYLSSPTTGEAASYDSVDVKVDGHHWKVVGTPGKASCTAGSATSHETTAGAGQ